MAMAMAVGMGSGVGVVVMGGHRRVSLVIMGGTVKHGNRGCLLEHSGCYRLG